ncbi:MAG: hypothetical protein IPM88_20430 [Nitrospira sp.]|nr:hypothetical protein [Nitrospira sp.]
MNRRRCAVGLWSVMVLSILAGPSSAGAHFVWVEADAIAPAETGQPLKIYFGEYSEFLREERGGRLDSIDGVTLRVQDSKQGTTEVALTKQVNHFAGRRRRVCPAGMRWWCSRRRPRFRTCENTTSASSNRCFMRGPISCASEEGRINEHERDQATPMAST